MRTDSRFYNHRTVKILKLTLEGSKTVMPKTFPRSTHSLSFTGWAITGADRPLRTSINKGTAGGQIPKHEVRDAGRICRPGQTYAKVVFTVNDELQHHARGCYSACSDIKLWNRQAEAALLSAEKYHHCPRHCSTCRIRPQAERVVEKIAVQPVSRHHGRLGNRIGLHRCT